MSSGGSAPNIPQYQSMGTADTGAISGIGNLTQAGQGLQGLYASNAPSYTNLLGSTSYNPQQGVNTGAAMQSAVGGLPAYANQALATGFNQNNALYNQLMQQTTDQTRAAEAARGIATTPYGAGVEAQNLQNFNNAWQQQLMANQQAAAGTANTLLGQYGSQMAGGSTLAMNAANNPIQALQSLIQTGNLSTAAGQAAISDYLNYMSGSTGAASAQAQAQNQYNQTQASALSGLGQLAGTLGSAYMLS
jgi:hypothetical protein